ncbi:MAG: alpha/beta fold hydrolase [Vicinamibacterales bacterium]
MSRLPATAVLLAALGAAAALGSEPAAGTVALSPFTIQAGATAMPAEEGMLFVPENRSNPRSRIIGVHFIRVRGTRQSGASPILFLPGGPGSFISRANIESPRNLRELAFLRASGRDVLFVNQRGNPALPLASNLFWPFSPKPLDRPETVQSEGQALREGVQKGQAEWARRGVDLTGYDIINIADDIDDLRQALRYQRVILRGGSFGSQWSFAVLKRHPSSVDRALFRGVEPLDYGYDSPKFLWSAVQRVAAAAEADPGLKPLVPAGGLVEAVKTILTRLETEPRLVTIANPKDGTPVRVMVGRYDLQQVLKYPTAPPYRDNLTRWPRFILELYAGDYRYLAATAFQSRTTPVPTPMLGLLIDNSLGISQERDALLKAETEQQWIGPVEPIYHATRDLTVTARVPDAFRADAPIATPTVLFQGDMDFSTPLENAVHQAQWLRRGHLTIVHGGTHSVDDEMEQLLPALGAALQRFLAADSDVEIDAAIKAMPAEATLPAIPFETMTGPSLYDRWLKRGS